MEEEDLDRKRRAYFVTELLKAEETKQSHLNVLSDERYAELLEEVRQAEMATKKTPLQYRRLSRFNILQVDGVERLISRTAKNGLRPYLKVDEVYEVLRKVHDSGGGHSGRDKMFSQIAKLYANVTKEMVLVYLACCQVCQGRQNKKQVGDEGGSPSLKLEEAEIKNEMQTTDETPTSFNEFDPGDTKPFKLEEYATVKDEMQTTDESPTGFNEFDQEDTKPIKLEETEMLRSTDDGLLSLKAL